MSSGCGTSSVVRGAVNIYITQYKRTQKHTRGRAVPVDLLTWHRAPACRVGYVRRTRVANFSTEFWGREQGIESDGHFSIFWRINCI